MHQQQNSCFTAVRISRSRQQYNAGFSDENTSVIVVNLTIGELPPYRVAKL